MTLPGSNIRAWLVVARVPFHSVGVLPFALGAGLAAQGGESFSWPAFWLGGLAVILIMLSTYLNGEYHDQAEDRLSREGGASRFSGGSGAVVEGKVAAELARRVSLASLGLTLAIGLLLALGLRTGPWTIPLGLVGLLSGWFYSAPPFRWVTRGFGELLIGLCYGWLPVATGWYLQRGTFAGFDHLLTVPIGLAIFNVILINEFHDYEADRATGKRNLTVRLGRERAALVYAAATAAQWPLVLLAARGMAGGARVLLFYVPVFLVSAWLAVAVLRGWWKSFGRREVICALTIVANLGTTMAFLVGALWG